VTGRLCVLAVIVLLVPVVSAAADVTPVVTFPGDGSLEYSDHRSGKTLAGRVFRGSADNLQYIPGHRGQGVHVPPGTGISIPIERFNPAEGALLFWFRPDWAVGDCTYHLVMTLDAGPSFRLELRKGFSPTISPDHGYVTGVFEGGTSFPAATLFTACKWRHYTLRWSAEKGIIGLSVDGCEVASGVFKTKATELINAAIKVDHRAAGAFDDVQLFERYLSTDELIEAAGLTRVAAYLRLQSPPLGAAFTAGGGREISYVDPATGRQVTEKTGEGRAVYNPALMPELLATPHTKWARPLAGGPLRTLLIMRTGFYDDWSMIREGVELWQRLDMQCVMLDHPDPEVMKKDYDVIIVVGLQGKRGGHWLGWEDWDAELRAWVLERVRQGRSGLVLTYPLELDGAIRGLLDPKRKVAPDDVLRGFPAAAMHRVKQDYGTHPAYYSGQTSFRYTKIYELDETFFLNRADLAGDIVECYRDGNMRAVKLNYIPDQGWGHMGLTPDTPFNAAATDVHYDYWQALAARAVLFAAGRQLSARISAADVAGRTWTVATEGPVGEARLWYRARDVWGREYARGELPGNNAGTLTIPGTALPPRAIVDFILKDSEDKVLDWYSAVVPPASDTKITDIKLNQTAYEKGKTIQGVVEMTSGSGGRYTLEVYLAEHAGRRIIRQTVPVELIPEGNASAPFQLAIPLSSESLVMRIDALLYHDKAIVDSRSADCPVPRTRFEGFYAGMSTRTDNRFTNRQRIRLFRDVYGMDLCQRGWGFISMLPRENLDIIEQTIDTLGYPGSGTDADYCMTSPDHWENFLPANLRSHLRDGGLEKLKLYRPLFYSLGEEHFCTKRSCQSPTCTARFQEHVREKFGTIEKLNEVWGTKFASWDEVTMLTPEVVDMQTIHFDPVRFENRRFMERTFAARHAYLAQYFRNVDPLAEVGIHVGWDLWMERGYDYWLLSKGMESMIGYEGPQNQYIRSFFKNSYGCYYHYSIGSHENVRWSPWYCLLSGARGFIWFCLQPGGSYAANTSDLHLGSDFQASASEYVAAGNAGDLLARTTYAQDQVAVHYSQDSFQAGVKDMTWIHKRFINLFFDAGVPFRFVSYEQVADGVLLKRKYRAVVLPHSISLSDGEVKALRQYVQEGGVLWADIMPGTYDNFGRSLPASQLADLFAGLEEVTINDGTYEIGKVGRGTVILADIGNYNYDRNVGHHRQAQALLDRVIEIGGIERVARVTDWQSGQPANGIWTAGYRQGGQKYVIACKDYQIADRGASNVRIAFGKREYVYEMRSGRYLGHTDQVHDRLEPTRARIYSVLPYNVIRLEGATTGKVARGRDLVLKVSLVTVGNVGAEDMHLIRTSVTSPQGQEVIALRRLTSIYGGTGEIHLPLAYDDPAGDWNVTLRDSATGITCKVPFTLQ